MTATTPDRNLRVLITPEELALPLEIAPIGSRIAAFGLDMILLLVATALIVGLVSLLGLAAGFGMGLLAVVLVLVFVLFNGYFLFFELRWQGATPGKRAMGLAVVSRHGGPLTPGAILARNLLRELELYLPLRVLMAPQLLIADAPGWALLIASLWVFLFLFFPLFNRDRARCGDLVAGTFVVARPRMKLLPDVAESAPTASPSAASAEPVFRRQQLEMYGNRELQVLERVLRDAREGRGSARSLRVVCDAICRKIAWDEPVPDSGVLPFLEAFYRAQRKALEHGLLMGSKRERKEEGRLGEG